MNLGTLTTENTTMPTLKKFPQEIQDQILYYLEANNFPAAKQLYDKLSARNTAEQSSESSI